MKEETIIDLLLDPSASFAFIGTPERKNELQNMIQQWRECGIRQSTNQGEDHDQE